MQFVRLLRVDGVTRAKNWHASMSRKDFGDFRITARDHTLFWIETITC
jgi:hypothetical protein